MLLQLRQIPFLSIVDYPEGLSAERAKKSFDDLRKNAYEVCVTSVNITQKEPRDALEAEAIIGQRRRRVKASGIFRHVKENLKSHGLSLSYNDSGNVSAQLVWKGSELRTAVIDGMGLFCDCPDAERDYKLCKHKLALVGLVVEAGNQLDQVSHKPQIHPLGEESITNVRKGIEDLLAHMNVLWCELSEATEVSRGQNPVDNPHPFYDYLESLGVLKHGLLQGQDSLRLVMAGMDKLGETTKNLS